MKVLVIGGGGREAAMCWRLKREGAEVFCAPGNAGIAQYATIVPVATDDIVGLGAFARREGISLTIIGPEGPLIDGIADRFEEAGRVVCGPSALAARAEGDKGWFKFFLRRHGLPTADHQTFNGRVQAGEYIRNLTAEKIVIKASGPMAGKGVYLPDSLEEASDILENLMVQGTPGEYVVIERRLYGTEVSSIAVTDGTTVHQLPFTRDYKREGDGDTGRNTGGMGAHTIRLSPEVEAELTRLTALVVQKLREDGYPFAGFIYLGFMLTEDGPVILECNCRLGDPEAQVLMMAMEGSFLDLCIGVATGTLESVPAPGVMYDALCVEMTSPEYPDKSDRDDPIDGLEITRATDLVQVFHAGTSRREGAYSTGKSGRILAVTAGGPLVSVARSFAYNKVREIAAASPTARLKFRKDIGAGET